MRYTEHDVTDDDVRAVEEVLRSRSLTQGPAVERFEASLAEYVGAKYAVAVSSGTAALHLAYLATSVRCVVTSPLSFVASASAALLVDTDVAVGFIDVDEATGCAVPHPDSVFPNRSAWVPVHYAGRASWDGKVAGFDEKTIVIEDACHALGAWDHDGCSRVGSCAHSLATVFSFHPAKHVTTGEGGAVTTNDSALAAELRLLRSHWRLNGEMVRLGLNYRMSDINAALGWSQLRRNDERWSWRAHWAWTYMADLYDPDETRYALPWLPSKEDSLRDYDRQTAWHLFTVRIKNGRRDEVKAKLAANGIYAQVHYSPIIPLQPYFRERFGYKPGDFPNAEAWAAEELSLPLYPAMTIEDVDHVCEALRGALR